MSDRRDLAKMTPSKYLEMLITIWQMEVDRKLRGSMNTSTYSHLYWGMQSSTKETELIRGMLGG
jgi:hypothetical protein